MVNIEKIKGMFLVAFIIFVSVFWFYFVLYNWLWLNILSGGELGHITYALVFILFIGLTIPILVLLLIGFLVAHELLSDDYDNS